MSQNKCKEHHSGPLRCTISPSATGLAEKRSVQQDLTHNGKDLDATLTAEEDNSAADALCSSALNDLYAIKR